VAYGYGLGLYVCRRLIEAQGGRIWAENALDGGAIFSFTLPVVG
jgi:signal transduction histidine kinase